MINLRISTPNGRINDVVERSMTAKQVIDKHDIITDGATINLDGIPLSYQEVNASFDDLKCGESATLSIVVKSDNGN